MLKTGAHVYLGNVKCLAWVENRVLGGGVERYSGEVSRGSLTYKG